MSLPPNSPDDLEQWLAPPGGLPPANIEAILTATVPLLPVSRPRTSLRTAALVGGALAAGVLAGWFGKPTPEPTTVEIRVEIPVRVEVPVPGTAAEFVAAEAPPTPEQLELTAEQTDEAAARAALYRQAGDLFLDQSDINGALRCYRLHLTIGGAAVRSATPTDPWLLRRMKSQEN
ncbi:MAG: hypothetical protein ACRCZF_26045 [Gemmataceae bacterium]